MRVEGFFGSYRQRLRTDPYLEPRMRALRHEEPAAFLYKLAFDAQGRRCVGFKFKYDELLLPQFSRHQAVIAQDLDIAIIHLRRRNLLKRYLSWVVVNRVTGRTMRTVRQESIDVPLFFSMPTNASTTLGRLNGARIRSENYFGITERSISSMRI